MTAIRPAHRNNFDLLRLLFATCVVFSHSFACLAKDEPVVWGRSLGNLSVHGFFVISGYLIANSFISMPKFVPFAWNRTLRILPAFIVAAFFTSWLAGMCEAFAKNPLPYLANGPIWTLTWEVVCYLLVALIGFLGVLTPGAMPATVFAAWLAFLLKTGDVTPTYGVIAPLMLMFLSGTFIRVCQDRINLNKAFAPMLVLLVLSFNETTVGPVLNLIGGHIVFLWGPALSHGEIARVVYMVSFPFVVMYLGLQAPVLWKNKTQTDVSYGVYIFAWPISQSLVYLSMQRHFHFNPYTLFLAVMAVTLPVAWLSWTLVEKQAMKLKWRTKRAEALESIAVTAP